MTLGLSQMLNHVTQGRCEEVMKGIPGGSVDFILCDPRYLVRYRDRTGRTVKNDNSDEMDGRGLSRDASRPEKQQIPGAVLFLEQGRPLHGGLAPRRVSSGGAFCFSEELRLRETFHGIQARAGLSAREGLSCNAGASTSGRHSVELHGQRRCILKFKNHRAENDEDDPGVSFGSILRVGRVYCPSAVAVGGVLSGDLSAGPERLGFDAGAELGRDTGFAKRFFRGLEVEADLF
jgi:hypothetical protein